MITIYTYNSRVLKNANNDNWYTKPEPLPPADEVQIGNQIWKTKNLNIDDGQGGIYTMTVNYGQGDVIEYFYTWAAALRVAASISGWHLPTDTEWNTLFTSVGGTSVAAKKLKSTYGWANNGGGTDDYGFTVLPAGFGSPSYHEQFGETAVLWTATQNSSYNSYANVCDFFTLDNSIDTGRLLKNDVCSVRLVKDTL